MSDLNNQSTDSAPSSSNIRTNQSNENYNNRGNYDGFEESTNNKPNSRNNNSSNNRNNNSRGSNQFKNANRSYHNGNQNQPHYQQNDFNYNKNYEKKPNQNNSNRNNSNFTNEYDDEYEENYRSNSNSNYRGANNNNNHTNHNKSNLDSSNRNSSKSWQKSRISNRNINETDENYQENQSKRKTTEAETVKKSNEDLTFSRSSLNLKGRRQQLLSTSSTNGAISCICCLHELFTFVYYSCLHFVCLNCAIKMRVLCNKIDCPVCRQESKQVVCAKKPLENQTFDQILKNCQRTVNAHHQNEREAEKPPPLISLNIFFEEISIRNEYNDILENRCDICSDEAHAIFNTFEELDSHIRKIHKRFYCDLCLEHLKLFPFERKHYNREELAFHKRTGDKNDYSFKGHPLCEHCDQRFFDRDELYRHYRKEHYFCHFCDHDGHEEYYSNYGQLRQHFLKHHFLCELDDCSKNSAETHEYVVFRSELDFQAHKKQKHAKNKSDSKNFAKLNIEFNVANDRDRNRYGNAGSGGRRGGGRHRHRDQQGASANVESMDEDDFNELQSKLKEPQLDPNILRISREQFEKEEEERNRQNKLQRLKEQHKQYEQSLAQREITMAATASSSSQAEQLRKEEPINPSSSSSVFSSIATSIINSTTSTNNPISASIAPAQAVNTQAQQSSWRNLVGAGNAPKLNAEIEFPSLVSETKKSSTIFPNKNNAWQTSNAKPTAEFNKKVKPAFNAKSEPKPEAEFLIKSKLNNEDDIETVSKKNKKKNKNKSQTQKPEMNLESDFVDASLSQTSKKSETLAPPPGFNTDKPIAGPPGFTDLPKNKDKRPIEKKENDSIIPPENEYIKPENYETRNQELTSKLFLLFGHYNEKEFQKFKSASIEFRKSDKMKAKDYLETCQKLLELPLKAEAYSNKKNLENKNLHLQFLDLVQEMIVLLPDSEKQSELYQAYMSILEEFNFTNESNLNSSSGINWASKTKSLGKSETPGSTYAFTNKLVRCNYCNQLFLNDEINFHQSSNHLKQIMSSSNLKGITDEFPSLAINIIQPSIISTVTKVETNKNITQEEDFPSLGGALKVHSISRKKDDPIKNEADFPALSTINVSTENRYSALPTPSIFSNPNSHLSLVKKKHRLQK